MLSRRRRSKLSRSDAEGCRDGDAVGCLGRVLDPKWLLIEMAEIAVAVFTRQSALGSRHPAIGTRHPELGTRHSPPSPFQLAVGTRHPAIGTRHSALVIRHSPPLPHSYSAFPSPVQSPSPVLIPCSSTLPLSSFVHSPSTSPPPGTPRSHSHYPTLPHFQHPFHFPRTIPTPPPATRMFSSAFVVWLWSPHPRSPMKERHMASPVYTLVCTRSADGQ